MKAVSDRVVTVFGGTGFLGRRIVRHLRLQGFSVRVASRHPDHGQALFPPDDLQLRSIKADVHDERSVADALADAYGAVNAVSLYIEQGQETFHSVHVESAQRVAVQAQRAGIKRLIHVSGIGADPRSPSLYIQKRGEGELAVREAFTDAILIRPAVMFGPDDAFLTTILKLLDRLPIYPMFGNGQMRLQPVYVEDVGKAIAKILQKEQTASLVRVRWPSRLFLRGISQSRRECSRHQADTGSCPIRRLACTGWDRWNVAEPANHAKSSGTNANRHHLGSGYARNGRTWNLPTFDR